MQSPLFKTSKFENLDDYIANLLNKSAKTLPCLIIKEILERKGSMRQSEIVESIEAQYETLRKPNGAKYGNNIKRVTASTLHSTKLFDKVNQDEYKLNKAYKNSECLIEINKNIDKCINSLKYYSTLNLKYSLIKPYGDALSQLLSSIERKNLNLFAKLLLSTILYGELDMNKSALLPSSRFNPVNATIPFLPPISKEYKYTLVLDMDETLVHFFFTHLSGMFFVRPFCFEFLNELNTMYEIVTFTAGTKDYADGILNQLDKNGDIIKYRLYRQHTSISGCNVYKDLSKLGRDLSRTIIIDNLRENFKMQPNNGIFIKTWTSDVNDVQFRELKRILKDIYILNVSDVRVVIEKMNEELKAQKNLLSSYANIDITKYV